MTAGDGDRQLGILIGQVQAMNARLDRADESRARTHARMDTMAMDVAGIKRDVDQVRTDIAEMKPEVAMVHGLRTKAAGAILVLGAIGALLGAVLTYFAAEIKAALARLFGLS